MQELEITRDNASRRHACHQGPREAQGAAQRVDRRGPERFHRRLEHGPEAARSRLPGARFPTAPRGHAGEHPITTGSSVRAHARVLGGDAGGDPRATHRRSGGRGSGSGRGSRHQELAARIVLGARGSCDVGAEHEGYLARLEAGELDPSRVSRRLLDALAGLLGGAPALRPAEQDAVPSRRRRRPSLRHRACSAAPRLSPRSVTDGQARPAVHRRPGRVDAARRALARRWRRPRASFGKRHRRRAAQPSSAGEKSGQASTSASPSGKRCVLEGEGLCSPSSTSCLQARRSLRRRVPELPEPVERLHDRADAVRRRALRRRPRASAPAAPADRIAARGSRNSAANAFALDLAGIARLPAHRLERVDREPAVVPAPVVPELVREREALPGDRLRAVDPQPQQERKSHDPAEAPNSPRRPSAWRTTRQADNSGPPHRCRSGSTSSGAGAARRRSGVRARHHVRAASDERTLS